MNHKSILILMMIFLFGAACTACGAGKGTEEQNASGSSVSTSSASGSPVREGDDSGGKAKKIDIRLGRTQTHFYANDTSYFMEVRGENGRAAGFDQLVKQGGSRREYRPEGFDTLLGVTDEGVYYAKKTEKSPKSCAAALYRIPFQKERDGRTKLEPEKEEKILEEPNGFVQDKAAYIDRRYIVYQPFLECIIKYDRRTKEKTELPTMSTSNSIVAVGEECLIFADLANNDEFLYQLDLDSDKLEEIWDDKENLLEGAMTAHSGYLFCARGDALWAYDIKKKERELLAGQKQLLEACGQAADLTGGQMPSEVYVEKLFCYNGRLYIQLQVDWKSGKSERMGYAVFYMDLSGEERELRYDASLSSCMRTRSVEAVHAITPTIRWNSGRCHNITEEGRVILILNRMGTVRQQLAYYNLRSREFKLINEEDKEYFIPYLDAKEAFGYEEAELEESFMMIMPDDLYS